MLSFMSKYCGVKTRQKMNVGDDQFIFDKKIAYIQITIIKHLLGVWAWRIV